MKKNSLLILSLVVIFVLSLCIRWYRLPEYLFFGFEQGRDAEQARAIFKLDDLTLVGPKTDIAGIFHGAWFYYLLVAPYFLGQGNPLVVSFTLVVISSLVPVGIFIVFRKNTGSIGWAFLAGILATVSFDLITYSRWLSNVSWAVPFLTVSLLSLNQYLSSKKERWFILSFFASFLAGQFQIILSLWLIVFWGIVLITGKVPRPTHKTFAAALISVLLLNLPLLLFNIKHSFISLKSVLEYLLESSAAPTSIRDSLAGYFKQLWSLYRRSILDLPAPYPALMVALSLLGLGRVFQDQKTKSMTLLFIALTFMSFPVIVFGKSLHLEQLYVGSSIGLIGLTVLSIKGWWRIFLGKFIVLVMLFLLAWNTSANMLRIHNNTHFYFITIQEGLEYRYQKEIIEYIRATSSETDDYFIKAFTIPYYQEQGWQYIRSVYLAHLTFDPGSKLLYVIIEPQVDPYWEKQWIKDLGETNLIEEKTFGKIRVQRRERPT